jgi:hypothetical protein
MYSFFIRPFVLSAIFLALIVVNSNSVQAHDTNVVSGAFTANTDVSIYHPGYAQLKHDVQWDEQYLGILEKHNSMETLAVSHPGWSDMKLHLQKLKAELDRIDNDKQMTSLSHLKNMQKEEQEIHRVLFLDTQSTR